jgi:putative protein-disulfide isomerase
MYDLFCGWCYGAAPLISAAQNIHGLQIRPRGIGMLSGNSSQIVSVNWADFVRSHDERITVYSDQAFGAPYARDYSKALISCLTHPRRLPRC